MELLRQQLAALEALNVTQTKRPDFDKFWTETVNLALTTPLGVQGKTIATLLPYCAALIAATYPAGPPPITTRSNFCDMRSFLVVCGRPP